MNGKKAKYIRNMANLLVETTDTEYVYQLVGLRQDKTMRVHKPNSYKDTIKTLKKMSWENLRAMYKEQASE